MRRVVFWIHLTIGVTVAALVLLLSVTGVALTYERQLNRWALRHYRASPPPGQLPRSIDTLLAPIVGREDTPLRTLTVRADPFDPLVVAFDDGRSVHVDRYTGDELGDGDTRTRRLLRAVLSWHRWLAFEGDTRPVGRGFIAYANLGFLGLVVSGLYLWWPRTRAPDAFRRGLWFRRGLTGRARDLNWHSVVGLWLAVPLLVIGASGAMVSFQWAGDLVYRIAGDVSPSRTGSARTSVPSDPALPPTDVAPRAGYDTIVETAAAQVPGWTIITLRDPAPDVPLAVTVDRGTGRQPARQVQLTIEPTSGQILERRDHESLSPGRRLNRWLRYAHTGEIYGVVGQTVAGLAAAGAGGLAWTGLAMAWRRYRRWGRELDGMEPRDQDGPVGRGQRP